ncbi:zinc-dependent alcohol dehydrogenase family protein [Virgibacillus sp. NKC19-3]|uniref:zinc-dependent alcohol dehydrogenase family protein n=1 Tax=Virgibacillus saliphilus TaxID=2831674 RepID=UPI001C9A7319|nr:zinc-dependent alcohol dehydrogenase family protein [Virgibacillus sp. NKC19-3]MBY7141808.1 zinc-dependent alcohol dehydrogenase family protein [Virgibacillus sp. NKC19-3]
MDATCIKFYEFGSPQDVLQVEYKGVQPPRENEVLVRMLARPINPSDLIPIRGSYAHRISLPHIPGYEGVGIVEDVGSFVSPNLVGKRVLPLRGEGTWQAFVRTSAPFAIPVPDSMDDFTASQVYINPITAWVICTEVLGLKPDDVLLVNACGSSIGHIFAQLSNVLGFKLIAITRNDTYTQDLLKHGASHVINTSEHALQEAVRELTNGCGADAAVDSIGGSSGTNLAFCVQPKGTFLTIGLLSGVQVDWASITNKANVNVTIFHLRHWNKSVSTKTWQATFHHVIGLIKAKKLRLKAPDSPYDLVNVKEAVRDMEYAKSKGKIFLTSE